MKKIKHSDGCEVVPEYEVAVGHRAGSNAMKEVVPKDETSRILMKKVFPKDDTVISYRADSHAVK